MDIFNTKVCGVFSLKPPHQGDSNENTQHTIIGIKSPEIIPNTIMFAAMGFFYGPKNEFEIAVVHEPSVFEPLKFYCKK